MNVRDKVLLLAFLGLVTVLVAVMAHPLDQAAPTGDTEPPKDQNQGGGHQHHHRRGGWGGHHGRGGGGCKHGSHGGDWHGHHHDHNHSGGGDWHHHHHHGEGHEGNGPPHGNPEDHRGQETGVPSYPITNSGSVNPQANPQRPLGSKQPESGYIVPTTPVQRPIQQQHNGEENIDATIDNIFSSNTPNSANRFDDTEAIRPIVDVRDGDTGRPAGVPSISDLVLAGDYSKLNKV